MEWIIILIIMFWVMILVPEIVILIPLFIMEFILRLFGKSFNDKSK